MKAIPVDVTRLQVLVVGEPRAQIKDGVQVRDRVTNQPQYGIDVTVIGERSETVQLILPENGFPKGLSIGTMVVPEELVAIFWEKPGRSGLMFRAKAIRVEGAQVTLKAAAA